MVNEYEERRQARADRYRTFAANAAARADAAYTRSSEIGERFAGGQPILAGHHSERGARRDQARMHDLMDKSLAESKSAEYWERRATAVEMDKSIERYDPEAPRKIRERIEVLEGQLARLKEVNALLKRAVKPPPPDVEAALEALPLIQGLDDSERADLASYFKHSGYQRFGYPAYHVTNLSANLRRYKERLKEVESWQGRAAALEVKDTKSRGGVTTYTLTNDWQIKRDRGRRNEAQYTVWNADNVMVGEGHWTWRNALSAAEMHNHPAEVPKPGERVTVPKWGAAVVYAVSQNGQVITVDLGEPTAEHHKYANYRLGDVVRIEEPA